MGGMTRLLLLLWAGVTLSTAKDLYKRIVNGQECGNNDRHFHVHLKLPGGEKAICGGSLISDRWILTAKHCRDSTMTAHLGLHPRPGKKIPPMKITDPPVIFNEKYDIMMLKLPKAAQIQPAALPTTADCKNRPKIGDTIQIAGYGPTAADSTTPSQTLQCADTKVAKCELLEKNPEKELCWDRNIAYPMRGDSGGGVMFKKKLYGVIASDISFMDVCEFLDDITDAMKKPGKCTGGKCTII